MPIITPVTVSAGIEDYTELRSLIAQYLNREDLIAIIPTFIVLAESRINRSVRNRRMIQSLDITIDSASENLPSDFLEAKHLTINDTTPYACSFVSAEQFATINYQRDGTAGKPGYYTIIGDTFKFAPTPDASYGATLIYYSRIPPLETQTTNWMLQYHPDVYLFMALLQAAPYLHDDERIPVWTTLVNTAIDELNLEDQRAQYNASPLVMRPRRAFG